MDPVQISYEYLAKLAVRHLSVPHLHILSWLDKKISDQHIILL